MTEHDRVPEEVLSFYPLGGCRGLACFVARRRNPARREEACARVRAAYCLGQRHRGPVAPGDEAQPRIETV